MKEQPLVTCLCLTMKGREDFLTRATECFLKQSYPCKEILYVADSVSDVQSIDLGSAAGMILPHAVRFSALVTGSIPIGKKRNLGCGSAMGDLIAIWDDDDFSAPGRLEDQVQQLSTSGLAVGGYWNMPFTDGVNWWDFGVPVGSVIGSSLIFQRSWWEQHPFPERQIGEDHQFAVAAHNAKQLHSMVNYPMNYQMYCTIHPGNTSKKNPDSDPGWRRLVGFQWPTTPVQSE